MASVNQVNLGIKEGGYDVEFVDKEPNDITCCICLFVLKEPMQAEECGHRFCKSCVKNLQRRSKGRVNCPVDRNIITLFKDKGKEREILNLIIKCKNKKAGCMSTFELRKLHEHIQVCGCQIIRCTNKGCQESFQRNILPIHLESICLNRVIKCQFCSVKHLVVEQKIHITVCDNYPIVCQACGQKDIARIKMKEHIWEVCLKSFHFCPYVDVGCQKVFAREEMLKHFSDSTEDHLQYAAIKIKEQAVTISKLEKSSKDQQVRINKLESKLEESVKAQQAVISNLENQLVVNSMKLDEAQQKQGKFNGVLIFKIRKVNIMFSDIKNGKNTISKYLFALEGYKLKVEVRFKNGGKTLGNYVGIYIGTIPGPFDDVLESPMKAQICFSVMKKKMELNAMSFNTDANSEVKKSFQKPPHNAKFMGYGKFIKDNHLGEYIVDNKLTLKVTVKPR